MKLLANWDWAPSDFLLSPNEAFYMSTVLYLIELLVKRIRNHQTVQDTLFQRLWLVLHKVKQGPIAKDNDYTTHWTWKSWDDGSIEPLHLCASIFVTGRYSVHYQIKAIINITYKQTLQPIKAIFLKILVQFYYKCYGSSQPLFFNWV